MVKISKSGKQYTISLPKDIREMKGWDENTKLMLLPFVESPNEEIDDDTPIILKEVDK